jgi:subtilisin family serine protease
MRLASDERRCRRLAGLDGGRCREVRGYCRAPVAPLPDGLAAGGGLWHRCAVTRRRAGGGSCGEARMRRYCILRNMSGAAGADPFGPGQRLGTGAASLTAPEPKLEVEDLEPREVREVARDPEVASIAPVMPTALIRPFPSAAPATSAWGIAAVGADVSPFDGEGVTVAVLDTGIDAAHPAFRGARLVERDFSGDGNGDANGHGTHCSGTIFGREVQGTRIGVAPGVATAFVGKVLGDDGSGTSEMIFRGLQWALEESADVISMSLGFDFPGLVARLVREGWPVELATSVALEAYRGNLRMFDALMAMLQARVPFDGGAVVAAAAGNESRREIDPGYEIAVALPAAAEGVLSVGALATGPEGWEVAPFSNTFPVLSAPGVDVVSARTGGGLIALSGTSMAAPHVAGVAALWWQRVREAPVRPLASATVAKLLASTRTQGFRPDVDPADRGMGIATAPGAAGPQPPVPVA